MFYRDKFNQVEVENTLRGRELVLFVLFYVVAVILIVVMFETVMPVLFIANGAGAKSGRRSRISFS